VSSFPTFANADPRKDTPLHQIVQWSKFDLLEEVIADDPFDSDHFAWIDLALGYVAAAPTVFPMPTDRVALLQMRPVADREVEVPLDFVRHERGRIAGGFFRGGRHALRQVIDEFRAHLASLLAQHFRPNEQMILGILTARRPELFDFYYGDYPSLLTNWDHVRRDVGAVLDNVSHCRTLDLADQAREVCDRIRSSIQAGALHMTASQLSRLEHEEDMIAATRAQRPFRPAVLATGKTPLVSVILPVHNGEETLERALRSVLGQSFSDLEVVIIDDASTDGSVAVARSLVRADRRVRVVTRGSLSGSPATPRDDGIALSTGRYVALLDQDDYWLSDKLVTQLALFRSRDVALVYSHAYVVSEAHGVRPSPTASVTMTGGRLPEGEISAELVAENVVPALTAVIRRDWLAKVGRFDRHHLVGTDDYYYWLRLSFAGGRFAAVQRPLAVHCRRHDGLGSARQRECAESFRRMWAALEREYPEQVHRLRSR
jgi:GT2 family glycosyltransferase